MGWNPVNKIRDRMNGGVSARVDAQLDWRDKSILARLEALEDSIAALQRSSTALTVSISDRVQAVEAAVGQVLSENRPS